MLRKYIENGVFEEIHFVFDRYEVTCSLKTDTRKSRQREHTPVQFRIDHNTSISNVYLMSKRLSYCMTKDVLYLSIISYLSMKILQWAKEKNTKIMSAWRDSVESNILDTRHLSSTQEEADTKLILRTLDAT